MSNGLVHLIIVGTASVILFFTNIENPWFDIDRFGGVISIYGVFIGLFRINIDIKSQKHEQNSKEVVDRLFDLFPLYERSIPSIQVAVILSIWGTFLRSYGDLLKAMFN